MVSSKTPTVTSYYGIKSEPLERVPERSDQKAKSYMQYVMKEAHGTQYVKDCSECNKPVLIANQYIR